MKKLLIVVVAIILAGGALFFAWENYHHAADAGHAHDAKTQTKGPGDPGDTGLKRTHFSDKTELFVEFPRLVVGSESPFVAHLTRLADFKAIEKGRVTVTLFDTNGKVVEAFGIDGPSVPGIFRPVVKPAQAGNRRLVLQLDAGDLQAIHDLGLVTVYLDRETATKAAAVEQTEEKGGIAFSKEQQWQIDFALAQAEKRTLHDAVATTGTIRAEANSESLVSATIAGQLVTSGAFPRIGTKVQAGQVLAYLNPRLGGDTDFATLQASARKARVSLEHARRERERMEALFAQEAIAEKRVHAARTEEKLAQAELDASSSRVGQYGGQGGGIPIRAPIAGVIGDIKVKPGSPVTDGQALFHIINTNRLWLEARIPESELGRIIKPSGAWFSIDGYEHSFEIADGKNGKVVAFGGVVDATTRTVPLILEFANPDAQLRIGMAARVHVRGARTVDVIAVPYSAVIDDAGQTTVFVQQGGESFERRIVRLGVREGDWVAVRSGVKVGERVVSRGAYLVKLAATAPATAGHGHAH